MRIRVLQSRASSALLGLALAFTLLGLAPSPAAAVEYPFGYTTFHYIDCSGPAGTPSTFDAFKPNHRLHSGPFYLADGSGTWILKEVVIVESGVTLFTTPGIEYSGLAVTCLIFSPIFSEWRQVTGYFAPLP